MPRRESERATLWRTQLRAETEIWRATATFPVLSATVYDALALELSPVAAKVTLPSTTAKVPPSVVSSDCTPLDSGSRSI